MRAITLLPGVPNSARLDEIPDPPITDGPILIRTLALGVCGTDREIVSGIYGEAPPGADRLVLGHESLGEVIEAPAGSGLAPGDHVVGIVRRPDPVPCPACAVGEWDMCRNGRYTERGIKGRNGYGAERFRLEPDFAVKADTALGPLAVLTEPASIVAKAWDQVERIGKRSQSWQPRRLLVTGSGPIGLLAAMMGKQRGWEVHILDRGLGSSKPALFRDLGARHHTGSIANLKFDPDVVMECTGAPEVVAGLVGRTAPGGIACLVGLGGDHAMQFDIGRFNRSLVLDNDVIFGSVNANHAHYRMAADALARADKDWLARLISRHVPLSRWQEALQRRSDDIKVVIDFTA
ncbi:MAG: glucose 1-dehydrogenase [Rhizobiales bacterium]|nr:glucose 1-dehydrogenase [Hyphomicrobiales bacterium]